MYGRSPILDAILATGKPVVQFPGFVFEAWGFRLLTVEALWGIPQGPGG